MTQEQIEEAVKKHEKDIRQWEKLCEEKIKFHQHEIKILQKFHCTHEQETYYPDPSGNSDSFYKCVICGNER